MTTGLVLKDSLIAVMKEVTEGTYVAPGAGTDFFQPIVSSMSLSHVKDWNESGRLTGSLGQAQPRGGLRSKTAKIGIELAGSGVAGQAPNWDEFIQSAMGSAPNTMSATATITTGATTTVLPMSSGDVSKFAIGMPVMVQKANNWAFAVVQSVQAGTSITVTPALPYSPSNGTIVSRGTLYAPANSGHPSLSISAYWGNKILEKGVGMKVKTMSLTNYKAGAIPTLEFDLEGFGNPTDTAASAGYTPSYDQALSPVVLNAVVYQGGNAIVVPEFDIKLDNTLSRMTSTADINGIIRQIVTKRLVTGSFAPWKDDTTVANFSNFNLESEFSLFITATNPDPANAGQYLVGNNFCIYIPNALAKTLDVKNTGGVLQDAQTFEANGGPDGSIPEIYLGFC